MRQHIGGECCLMEHFGALSKTLVLLDCTPFCMGPCMLKATARPKMHYACDEAQVCFLQILGAELGEWCLHGAPRNPILAILHCKVERKQYLMLLQLVHRFHLFHHCQKALHKA